MVACKSLPIHGSEGVLARECLAGQNEGKERRGAGTEWKRGAATDLPRSRDDMLLWPSSMALNKIAFKRASNAFLGGAAQHTRGSDAACGASGIGMGWDGEFTIVLRGYLFSDSLGTMSSSK